MKDPPRELLTRMFEKWWDATCDIPKVDAMGLVYRLAVQHYCESRKETIWTHWRVYYGVTGFRDFLDPARARSFRDKRAPGRPVYVVTVTGEESEAPL